MNALDRLTRFDNVPAGDLWDAYRESLVSDITALSESSLRGPAQNRAVMEDDSDRRVIVK